MYNEQCTCIPCPKVAPPLKYQLINMLWGEPEVVGRTQRFTAHLPSLYICVSHQKFHCIYNIHLSHHTTPHILHYFTQLLYTKQETTIPRHCSSIYIKSFCTASHNACFLAYKWTFMHPNIDDWLEQHVFCFKTFCSLGNIFWWTASLLVVQLPSSELASLSRKSQPQLYLWRIKCAVKIGWICHSLWHQRVSLS